MEKVFLFKQYVNRVTGLAATVKSFNLKDYTVTVCNGAVYSNEDFHKNYELKSSVPYFFYW